MATVDKAEQGTALAMLMELPMAESVKERWKSEVEKGYRVLVVREDYVGGVVKKVLQTRVDYRHMEEVEREQGMQLEG